MNSNTEIIDFDSVELYLISGNIKNVPSHLHEIHQKSFACWHETWDDFYHNELHIDELKLFSNEFTRQDEVLALFYKGECFALTFFKEVNWNDSSACLDSYFEPWPEAAIKGLRANGDRILICSQFTVSKRFRERKVDVHWKTMLFSLSIKRFIESGHDAMTGTMRAKKGMGRMSVDAGATMLAPEVMFKDERYDPADLVAFFPQDVKKVYEKNPYAHEFDMIWERQNNTKVRQLRRAA